MKLARETKYLGKIGIQPKVSIFFLTFNHEKYIKKSLESVLAQDVEFEFEILVYDDCSTDQTLNVIFSTNPPENVSIRVFQSPVNLYQKNLLNFLTHQIVIEEARSNYVAYLEGDDFFGDKKKLKKQFIAMEADKSAGFCFHNANKVDANDKFLSELVPQDFRRNYSVKELSNFRFAYIHGSTVFWRRSPLPWPPEYFCCTNNADMIAPFIWAKSGYGMFMSDILPNGYRQTQDGIWSGLDEKRRAQLKLQTSLMMASLHLRNGDTDAAKGVIAGRAIHQINSLFLSETPN